ncbi:hypothetical protein H8U31_001326 [Salmonella enterica]|nr:hypothetical protein [Salmonella enterica]EFO7976616.1 hypothetical protein [Salmonella enterica]EGC0267575.1 hypothetical protein [Salmonella enterica]
MAKQTPPAAVEAATPEIAQTLEEFCARKSATDARYELIAMFFHTEKQAGRKSDLPSAFAKRFEEYLTTPVGRGNK